MKDILNAYIESTVEMRAMLAQRTPGESAHDEAVLSGLRKGWPIKKALKRAAEKHPAEALQWTPETLEDIEGHYDWLLKHEEIMAKAKALGFKEEIRFIPPRSNAAALTGSGEPAPGMSFVALNRIMEKRMTTEPGLAEDLAQKGKGCLRFGRAMTDEQLIDKVRVLGLSLDRTVFDELRKGHLSAEEMSLSLSRERRLTFKGFEEEWLWVCLTVLWERWASETPNLEMIDDAMQEGYDFSDKGESDKAITAWFGVWKNILAVMDANKIKTLHEFNAVFRGSQFVRNWVQDVETELLNACWQNNNRCSERIRFCEEVIERTAGNDSSMIEDMRRAIGDSYAVMDDRQQADSLFDGWLKADPEWGWGWIGWSDSYALFTRGEKDYGRAEQILKSGLAASGVRDRDDLLERLMRIYEETGRKEDAERIREELGMPDERLEDGEIEESIDGGIADIGLSEKTQSKKIGRNEPCPCGSGKKYKKCCIG